MRDWKLPADVDTDQLAPGATNARIGLITRADGSVLACNPIPDFLLDMVEAGGLLPQLKQQLKQRLKSRLTSRLETP